MIKIEHIAMYVFDLERSKAFFEKYFNAVSGKKYLNEITGFESYFLNFKGNTRLEIMTKSNLTDSEKAIDRTGYIHIAFSVGSKENVDLITNKLKADGYKVISGPRTTGDGYYESCIIDFEGNQIEITI